MVKLPSSDQHKSTLPLSQISLAPIRQDPSRSSSIQAKDPQAPIVPQAPIKTSSSQATIKPQSSTDQDPRAPVKHRLGPTSSDQASVKTHELRSTTGQDPLAPIKTHKLRSVSLLVCPCGFVCVWVCGCGCVCLCASEEKENEERKTEFVGCAQRRERKKCANGN